MGQRTKFQNSGLRLHSDSSVIVGWGTVGRHARLRPGRRKAPDSLSLISHDGGQPWVMRSNPQLRQRDDKDLFGPTWCDVAHDPAFVTRIEDALDGEGTIGAG